MPNQAQHLSNTLFRRSALAFAIAQCFTLNAFADTSDEQTSNEVIINGTKQTREKNTQIGGFLDGKINETPISIRVLGQQELQNWQVRNSSDAMKWDASVNDAYNAVGYAEQFSIRGFALDNNASYRKDGMAISGDASIPLENKERIEILKGLAGFQAGFASPGGIINYVVKRPSNTAVREATVALSERGSSYAAVDLGDKSTDKQFGYRINAAEEKMRPNIRGANGERSFISGAFDWQISSKALLQIDADYQKKSQISAPGFQLIGGTQLPQNINADLLLNAQPWSKPVTTHTSNLGLRFEYQLEQDWQATFSANRHSFKRDDYAAFPYGCAAENLFPGYCANGDFDVYDYQSVNESKSPISMQAIINGKVQVAGMQHQLAFGYLQSRRADQFGDYVYDGVGTSNLFHPQIVPASTKVTGAILLQRKDRESAFSYKIVSSSIKIGPCIQLTPYQSGACAIGSQRCGSIALDS